MSGRGIIIDTNLLILLVVGMASRDYIKNHRRLKSYNSDDYDLLVSIASNFGHIVLTPNTLTETSNLIGKISSPAREHILKVFQEFVSENKEIYHVSRLAIWRSEFLRLGLTDSVLLNIGDDENVLLTADVELWLSALNLGQKAENFNHYRQL